MDIRLKHCISLGHSDGAATYRLTFGLCRGLAASRATKGRSLPVVITSGQDAQPPYGIQTMSLAAIEIYLKYHTIEQQLKDQAKLHFNDTGVQYEAHCQSPASFLYQHLADANIAPILDLRLFNHNPSSYPTGVAQVDPQTSTPFYQLLEVCLQRLILGVTVKIPEIRVAGSTTLQNLSHLAPVIFNAGYNEVCHYLEISKRRLNANLCQAMSQRAVSMNPLAKSIASMLENTTNPILQKQISRFLQQSQSAVEAASHKTQCGNNHRSIIQSALWRITQARLPKPKPARNAAQFFVVGLNAEWSKSNKVFNGFGQDESSDHELLELDWDRNLHHDHRHDAFDVSQPAESYNSEEEIDGLLIDTSSESSFRDVSESTQITLDWEDPSSPDSDIEMLLELEPEEGIAEGDVCF